MDYKTILYEKVDGIARITLNRPEKLNALSVELRHELVDAVKASEHDPEVAVIVINANGRAFSAGYDITPSPKTPSISPYVSPSLPTTDSEIRTIPAPPAPSNESRITNPEPRVTRDEPRTRIHIIQKGDTLSSISAKYYGSAGQWRKIVAANRGNLPDPNRLTPGIKLIIPD